MDLGWPQRHGSRFMGVSIARPQAKIKRNCGAVAANNIIRSAALPKIPLRFDEGSQLLENGVPLRGNLAQVAACLLQPPLLQLPHPLSPASCAAH